MSPKIILAGLVIVSAVAFGVTSFVETSVEYADFASAISTQKKVQVKGVWQQDDPSSYDAQRSQFHFVMADESGREMKVFYDGARPNNFELADAIVVKGRYEHGSFHATEILTKCPSKYEETGPSAQNMLQEKR